MLGDASTALGNSIVTLVSFLLLFWLLKRVAWKPLMNMLEERERTIQEDLDKAQSARQVAEKQEAELQNEAREARSKANELLTRAQVEGNEMKKTILDEARADAERIRQHAHKEIELERQQTLESLRSDISEMSLAIAEKMIGRELHTNDQDRLIEEFIDELGK